MKTKPAPKPVTLIPRRQGKSGDLLPITMKEQTAFNAVLAAELAPYLLPESEQDEFYYHMECEFGPLYVCKPFPAFERGEDYYWIFIQFRGSPEQFKAAIDSGIDITPHCGKWNINAVTHPQDAIDELKRRLKRVNAKPVALHAAAKEFFGSMDTLADMMENNHHESEPSHL